MNNTGIMLKRRRMVPARVAVKSEEAQILLKIAQRAEQETGWPAMAVFMDLSATQMGGCQLRLEELLNARSEDFLHDIRGINANLNHITFRLENEFWPRMAAN